MKRPGQWLNDLSVGKKTLLGFGAVIISIAAIAGASPKQATLNTTPASQKSSTSQSQPTPTTKTETETQPIAFTSTTVNSAALAKGTTKVTTTGVNGSQTLTYKVTYTNGKQTDKKLISTTVTSLPVAQVTSVGTYVAPPPPPPAPSCPNGTYVNSAGNTVCSPYQSNSAPAGATAQCVDGTYSFSQSRSGTCSHHGGVAQWL